MRKFDLTPTSEILKRVEDSGAFTSSGPLPGRVQAVLRAHKLHLTRNPQGDYIVSESPWNPDPSVSSYNKAIIDSHFEEAASSSEEGLDSEFFGDAEESAPEEASPPAPALPTPAPEASRKKDRKKGRKSR